MVNDADGLGYRSAAGLDDGKRNGMKQNMWYVAVYATSGAIVIFLLGMTRDFAERYRGAVAIAEEQLWFDERAIDLIMLVVAAVLLLTWPNLPVAFARRRLRRRRDR